MSNPLSNTHNVVHNSSQTRLLAINNQLLDTINTSIQGINGGGGGGGDLEGFATEDTLLLVDDKLDDINVELSALNPKIISCDTGNIDGAVNVKNPITQSGNFNVFLEDNFLSPLIQADSTITPTPASPIFDGWGVINTVAGTKINWYFYADIDDRFNRTLGSLNDMFFSALSLGTSQPFIVVFTKPLGDGNDAGSFFRSRLVYNVTNPIYTGSVLYYLNEKPVNLKNYPTQELVAGTVQGNALETEEILYISLHTNSAAAIGTVQMAISGFGYIFEGQDNPTVYTLRSITELQQEIKGEVSIDGSVDANVSGTVSVDGSSVNALVSGNVTVDSGSIDVSGSSVSISSGFIDVTGTVDVGNTVNVTGTLDVGNQISGFATETTLSSISTDVGSISTAISTELITNNRELYAPSLQYYRNLGNCFILSSGEFQSTNSGSTFYINNLSNSGVTFYIYNISVSTLDSEPMGRCKLILKQIPEAFTSIGSSDAKNFLNLKINSGSSSLNAFFNNQYNPNTVIYTGLTNSLGSVSTVAMDTFFTPSSGVNTIIDFQEEYIEIPQGTGFVIETLNIAGNPDVNISFRVLILPIPNP